MTDHATEYLTWVGLHAMGDLPHPLTPGGVPEGWTVLAPHLPSPTGNYGADKYREYFLVRPTEGGYLMLTYDHRNREMFRGAHARSIEGMYRGIARDPDVLLDWLAQVIASYYDLTNPAEAAEATLVALGRPLTVFPAALLEPQDAGRR